MNFYPKEKTFLVTSYHFTDIRQCQEQRNISEVERVSFPYFYQYWILLRNFSNKGVREITMSEMVFLKYLHHPASLKNNSTSTILELSIIFIIFYDYIHKFFFQTHYSRRNRLQFQNSKIQNNVEFKLWLQGSFESLVERDSTRFKNKVLKILKFDFQCYSLKNWFS